MKVTGFEVFPVVCPPPFRGGRSWLFVRLDTDNGIRGYGEMMLLGVGFRLPVLAAMVADIIEQAVVGHDPYDVEMLFDTVYGRAGYSHYPELTKLAILSAIETRSSTSTSARSAASLSRRRSRAWPRRTTFRSRRTSTAGR